MTTEAINKQHKFNWAALLGSVAITLAIGFTASFFTRAEIGTWYAGLNKPSFNPPNWLFAPVWTTLYVLIGISAALVWQRRDGSVTYKRARAVYFIQLALNFIWSPVFFTLHLPLPAFFIIIMLIIAIVSNIILFARFSRVAAWLLAPYLAWVLFASALNLSICLLNP